MPPTANSSPTRRFTAFALSASVPPVMTESPSDYLYPTDLFDSEAAGASPFWCCVRARPRWEKKLARWLQGRQIPHFLPVHLKTTVSHRKKRTHTLALFPGYVFVAQDISKADLSKSACAVRVLKPQSDAEAKVLHDQLHSLWLAIQSGQPMAPLTTLKPGQRIEVTEGTMKGMEGIYVRDGRGGSLILEVEMLASAVAVEIPPDCRFLVRGE
jgi:transcription antitermination factor NusG